MYRSLQLRSSRVAGEATAWAGRQKDEPAGLGVDSWWTSISASLEGSVEFYQAGTSLVRAVRMVQGQAGSGHGSHYGKESQFGWRGEFSCQLKSR